jgi:hypothetical protein
METAAAPETPQAHVFTIAGRTFRRSDSTQIDQDAYVMKRMREAGLVKMWDGFNPKTDTLSQLIEAIIFDAFERGVLWEILGGILVEDGIEWTRAIALANANTFRRVTDPIEKEALFANIADVLIDFLGNAAAWSATSPESLRATMQSAQHGGGDNSGAETPATTGQHSEDSEAIPVSISESGTD